MKVDLFVKSKVSIKHYNIIRWY